MELQNTTRPRRAWPIHSLLFVLYPVVALYALNQDELAVTELIRPIVVSVFVALAIWGVFAAATREARKSAVLASVVLLGCYVCWGVFAKAGVYAAGEALGVKVRYVAGAYALVVLLAVVGCARVKSDLAGVTRALNAIAVLLVAMAALQAAWSGLRGAGTPPPAEAHAFPEPVAAIPDPMPARPNVWFIVLDSYARADVLQSIFNYDNTPFLNRMRDRGFFVADASTVSYTHTVQSLPACLSMDYLENMGFDENAPDYGGVEVGKLFHYSQVHGMFAAMDYNMAAVTTGFRFTDPLDYYNRIIDYEAPWWEPTLFEIKILDFSPALRVLRYAGVSFGHDNWRRRLLYNLDHLSGPVADAPDQPWFVFAHILAPHAPFVFRADGSASPPAGVLSLTADTESTESYETYKRVYAAQVSGLNVHIERSVDAILAVSPTPPVIAIVSDHGPKLEHVYPEGLKHTLFMLHLPGGDYTGMPDDVNLVDLFPLIFQRTFGLDVPRPAPPDLS